MKKMFLLLLLVMSLTTSAQQLKCRPTSYNYTRGVELIQQEKNEEALRYFQQDLEDNPRNGYSYSWLALIMTEKEEYGKALNAANKAIGLLPKKDAEYVVFAYTTRSKVYLQMEDTVKALADLTTAIKIQPYEQELYYDRASIYTYQKNYELSDADLKKIIELEEGNSMAYFLLGYNAAQQKKWDEAIKYYDKAEMLSSDNSQVYSYRAEAYLAKEKCTEAIDDLVKALNLDWDTKALYLINEKIEEPIFSLMISKFKIQSTKTPNESKWPYIIGSVYEQNEQYDKAIEWYKTALTKDAATYIYSRLAQCQLLTYNYDEALRNINHAIAIDSMEISYREQKAAILFQMNDISAAIAQSDDIIAIDPEYEYGYLFRASLKQLEGKYDEAEDDYTTTIAIDPTISDAYANRAFIYELQGKKEQAQSDYKKVIELEDIPDKYDNIPFALQAFGDTVKAIAAMDTIIARDSTDEDRYYNAACLYSRMKNKDMALKYLEKSLELGYKGFINILDKDLDMDFLRETPEYKALINKYKSAVTPVHKQNNNKSNKEQEITEVPFTKEYALCKVKCQINGLPLEFLFDTGASNVTLSMVEASFMMKNGYLSQKDVIGNRPFSDANGNVNIGTVVNLRKVKFAGIEMQNIRATVVKNQKAPLLLGQSVLARLGKIEIDYAKKVLKITRF